MMLMLHLGVLTCVCLSGLVAGEPVLVDTVYGPVEGHTVDLSDGSHVNSFLGIPFAKSPNGTLRWKVSMGKHIYSALAVLL